MLNESINQSIKHGIFLTRYTFSNCNSALHRVEIVNYHNLDRHHHHHRHLALSLCCASLETHRLKHIDNMFIRRDVDDFAFEYTHNYVQIAKIERFVSINLN